MIHVVANGHATPRRTAGTTGTATATRAEQLAAELEDWAITSHRIASMAVRRDKPVWLVIAVTKTDLYADELEDVVRYYSPGSGSPFGDKIDDLRALAGGAKLSVDVLPVSTQGGGRNRRSRPRRPARWSIRSRPGWPSSAVTSEVPLPGIRALHAREPFGDECTKEVWLLVG